MNADQAKGRLFPSHMNDICYYDSPVGLLGICVEDGAVIGISLCESKEKAVSGPVTETHRECMHQLSEYFRRERKVFTVPVRLDGTVFQKKVWNAIGRIPYGSRVSYAEIAKEIGCEKGCRAVGNAVHNNPVPIIIPCHRVVRSSGISGGFAWGTEKKDFLLGIENVR